jgi:hypothetical protein
MASARLLFAVDDMMTRIKKQHDLVAIALLLCANVLGLPDSALASTYRTSNGGTVVVLREDTNQPASLGGFYFTFIAGREWMGSITDVTRSAGAGHTFYIGTFQDQAIGPGPAKSCKGTIRISRQNPVLSDRVKAQATWQINGGAGCPSVGHTSVLTLVEPLPRPDRHGDFTAANANTFRSETSGDGTWPAWRMVSGDGQLNCRSTPNGPIQKIYTSSDRILAETRGINAITIANGSPWLLTLDSCYVRANSRYLQPISIPI